MWFYGENPCEHYKGPSEAITMLAKAAYRGDLESVKAYVPGSSDVLDAEAIYHALTFASLGTQLEVISYLLTIYPPSKWQSVSTHHFMGIARVDEQYPGTFAWDLSDLDNGSVITTFLDHGLDPNWEPSSGHGAYTRTLDSILYFCANRLESVRALLAHGADLHKPVDDNLRTPLCRAAESNDVGCVGLLLDHGASFGYALWAAAREEAIDAAKLLIERGVNVNEHCFFNREHAPDFVYLPKEATPQKLFDCGTALHAAIIVRSTSVEDFEGAHFDMAKLLVLSGASLDEKDFLGKTPFDYAQTCKNCYWSTEQIEFFKPKSDSVV